MFEDKPASVPLIPQFFAGRAVFITGATGFMGKVLVERLLWTCPEIGKLFLLMRDKASVKSQDRLLRLKQSQVFDVLRDRNPTQLDKLVIVAGDISKPGLGISPDSLAELEEVSVVFNCAATLRFTEPLRIAAEQNVQSVMRLMDVCDRLPGIKAFVHVSTAYCNTERASIAERASIGERVYPLPSALPSMLAHALAVPDDTDVKEVKRIIYPKHNTYLYTKMLAESAVMEHGVKAYPKAIFRPTMVTSSLKHPFPGWIDTYTGPAGFIVAISMGYLRVLLCKESVRPDYLPVDTAIDALIAVAWETAIDNLPTIRVYNCSTIENPTTYKDMLAAVVEDSRQNPLSQVTWYPSCFSINNRFIYETVKFLVQTIPFHLIEYLTRLFNRYNSRKDLIKVHTHLCKTMEVSTDFMTREWTFSVDNMRYLRKRLAHSDRETFNLDPTTIDWKEYHKNFARGCRVYLLKDREENLQASRKRLQRLYIIYLTAIVLLPILLFWVSF